MAKRINVSLPNEDLNFCKSRDLKPSKLLQERITQIRDEQNPVLRNNLKEQTRKNEMLTKKIEFLATRFQKVISLAGEKLSEEDLTNIIDKI